MENTLIPEIASVCGLYYGACGIYLATQQNDIEKLTRYAAMLKQPLSETRCEGCRSDRKTAYCNNCFMIKCSREKNIPVKNFRTFSARCLTGQNCGKRSYALLKSVLRNGLMR